MPSEKQATERWLNDICYHITLAQSFVGRIDYEAFKDNTQLLYAVTRCLEIISEASRRIPDELKARYPAIEWQHIAAAGNIYRHQYEDVAPRRIWMTLTVSLPQLLAVVKAELAQQA